MSFFSPGMSRRRALQIGAGGATALSLAPWLTSCSSAPSIGNGAKAKNVIFMVADGMSIGVPSLAEPFSQLVRKTPTHWYQLAQAKNVTHGLFETSSLNSMVTDSAPASSAWGTGSRVFNRVINYLPDGQRLTPLMPLAQEAGRMTGIVTTATVTHATPAGFLAAEKNRDDEADIADQYLKIAPDLILGGGSYFFSADGRDDDRELSAEFAQRGYALLTERKQLAGAAGAQKILGLFDPSMLPYTIDWMHNAYFQTKVPTLAEMTRLALHQFKDAREGFLLQIEGARVDHAAHANDPGALLWDQLAFDDAIGEVLDFVRERDDTLVIITTDHGNANPGLNGMSPEYNQSTQCFARLADFKTSFATLRDRMILDKSARPGIDVNSIAAMIFEATGLALKQEQAQALLDACNANAKDNSDQHASYVGLLGEFTGNHTGIGWTGTTHTADLVPILALGPGRDAYQGLLKNTGNYERLAPILGISHVNPAMTPEQAAPFIAEAVFPPEEKPHWLIGNY